jgi:hypothetical protein
MAANPSNEMSSENMEQPANIESTHVLQQPADTAVSYTRLSTCDAAAIAGYSNLQSESHDEMYVKVLNCYSQLTPNNVAKEKNYFTLLADDQPSEPDLNNGYLGPVNDANCDALEDACSSDVTNGAIVYHQKCVTYGRTIKQAAFNTVALPM